MGPIEKVVRTLVSLHRLHPPLVNAQNTFARWHILYDYLYTSSRACVSTTLCDGVRALRAATAAASYRRPVPCTGHRVCWIWRYHYLNNNPTEQWSSNSPDTPRPYTHRLQSVYDISCTHNIQYVYNDGDNAIMWLQTSAQLYTAVFLTNCSKLGLGCDITNWPIWTTTYKAAREFTESRHCSWRLRMK